jgi:hypothetical protein
MILDELLELIKQEMFDEIDSDYILTCVTVKGLILTG